MGVHYALSLSGQSAFIFSYYDDETVASLFPRSGFMTGETHVLAVGSGFVDAPFLSCRFGEAVNGSGNVVRATYVDPTSIACHSPPLALSDVQGYNSSSDEAVAVEVYVANNGIDFVSHGLRFHYLPPIELHGLSPKTGPETGGTVVTIEGANFPRMHALTCRFGTIHVPAVVLSATQLQCTSPSLGRSGEWALRVSVNERDCSDEALTFTTRSTASVHSIEPAMGPLRGGSRVTVRGNSFHNGSNAACSFGPMVVPALFISPQELLCISPAAPQGGLVHVEVSIYEDRYLPPSAVTTESAYAWTRDEAEFRYVDDVALEAVTPRLGPCCGGTVVSLHGLNLAEVPQETNGLVCRFAPIGREEQEGIMVPATLDGATSVSCVSPTVNVSQTFGVSLSVNGGHDFSSPPLPFQYYTTPKVTAVAPMRGVAEGGSLVRVTGQGFVPSDKAGDAGADPGLLICRFGNKAVNASTFGRYLSPSLVECPTPVGHSLQAREVQRVVLTGAPDVREVQSVEVSTLPAADEVQQFTTTAWGTQPEVRISTAIMASYNTSPPLIFLPFVSRRCKPSRCGSGSTCPRWACSSCRCP
jgi:hypothetical protein